MNSRFASKHLNPRLTLFCAGLLLLLSGAANRCHADAVSDIVVGYGATEAGRYGSASALEATIYTQVASANAVAYNSGSPHRMRVAGLIQSATDIDGWTSAATVCDWLNSYSNIGDVRSYADYLGADLVAYVCKMYSAETAGAVAWQPGRYSAYNDQTWWTYWAHEAGGHNFGLDHSEGRIGPTTVMMNNYCGGGAQGFYSNPNIWLNSVQLIGGIDVATCTWYGGGDEAYHLSTTAQGRADAYDRLVWGSYRGAIKYRWQFTNAPGAAIAGTVVTDKVASAQAIVRGQGATFTGTALRLPGGTTGNTAANSIAAYVDLPNGMFSAMTNFTIEIWATPLSAQNWTHVIDIGRTTEAGDGLGAAGEYTGTPGSPAPGSTTGYDEIGLSAAVGTSLNSQRLIAGTNGSIQIADSSLTTTAGDLHHYVITFTDTTSGGTIKWYRDGALANTLNVAFHAANVHDVNNWLGRSLWSGDSMANMDYYDVRIQNIALTDGQVTANYLIGPNDKVVTLWANDGWGNSSFVSGAWEFGQSVPDASHDYESGALRLLSPWTTTDSTFPGRSLTISGGNFYLAGKDANTITVNDLRLNGATIHSFGDNGSTETLAGQITVIPWAQNQIRGENGQMIISAKITGLGVMQYTENMVTLTGNNTNYTGQTIIGDGRFSTLKISNETNLGGNPPSYWGDALMLNRGILVTTATMAITNANRGVRIGPSGGFFRPNSGTKLTITTPISSPAAGNTLQTAPMDSNPIMGILFVDGQGVVELTSSNNSHNAEMQVNAGELLLSGNGRINNGNHWMPITVNALFTDNSALDQILSGRISGNGSIVKSNTSILSLNGANTFSGSVTVNGGTLYCNPGNAANNRALSYAGSITVNTGGTLRSGANGIFGWDGTQAKPITVNAGGTLTCESGADVNVGSVTLNGGTLAGGPSTAWGSWNFKRVSGGKLIVTANSTVTATNVGFGTNNSIDVAAGKTLTFSGNITDLSSEGVCSLVKSNGIGTLLLSGANTYTGVTAVKAGTLLVNGSIGSGAVTIASGASLGGNGTLNGATTVNFGGTLTPGSGIGKLTVSNTVTLQAGSTTLMEISKAPKTNDQLRVTGALTIGGTLTVVNLGGTLAANDSFQLFSAGSTSSTFTATNLPTLGAGLGWSFNSASGVLSVVQTVVTNPTNISFTISGGNLTLSWPADHTGWRLQMQTNALATGLGTNWFDVIGSVTTNSVTQPIDLINSSVFYRLTYQ